MLINYFKLALRKLTKQRDYTLLNVFGLALSVGCSVLIFMLLRHHFSFDKYHKNADRIVRVVMDVKTENAFPFPGTPNPMAQALREEIPFLEKTAMRMAEGDMLVTIANADGSKSKFMEGDSKFAWVEPSYFEILDLPLSRGNFSALSEPGTVIISERLAQKYFGNAEALGKIIRTGNATDLRVVGIMKNLPKNTDYRQEILGSWVTQKTLPEVAASLNDWGGARGDCYCFAMLKPGHALSEMDAVTALFCEKHPHPEDKDLFTYKVKPLLSMHFDTEYGFDNDLKFFWALGFIGLFLLITACVNFVNMATAQALTRGREVGVRKSLGSTRGQLFWQFMTETGLIVGTSLIVGLFLARLALPHLNTWLKVELAFERDLIVVLTAFLLVLYAALTFLAGFYPGWMQARFNPVISMRNTSGELPGKGHFSMRRVLVTTQFVISQVLIIGAAVVAAQMRYAQDVDWGFRPGAVLTLEIPDTKPMKSLQSEILQVAGVKNVSLCNQPPAANSNNYTGIHFDNRPEPEQWIANVKIADATYLETFGLKLVAGRNITPSDTIRDVIVNETFVKKLNLSSPEEVLNKKVGIGSARGTIVGVIKDFHNWELAQEIAPIALNSYAEGYATCAIQLTPGNPTAALEQIRKIWERHYPDNFYSHTFMDERLAEFMEQETTLLRLINTFAGIAILIGCLGLYGLATFMATRKRKEIGIRKTLGASLPGILWLFGKEYTRLILIAFVVAAPLAWWAMNAWLQDYVYHISIGAGIFAFSLLATVLIAFLTVGFQGVKAALANPIKSLRSE
jgi:putative ABC transport system permease protein